MRRPWGCGARDFGELTILAFVGAALLVSITFAHRGSRYARTVSILVWLSGVLVFFGVVVDMVHSAVGVLAGGLTVIDEGGIILEEIGEMVTMSFITGYVVHLLEGQGHRPGLPGVSTLTAFGRRWRRRAGAWTSAHRARPAGEHERRP